MRTITYQGYAYRQATDPKSPWIVNFVAPAEDILEWAGIPRRTVDDDMAGFQRAYDDGRVERAKEFFDIPVNQSPTALVIGFHPQIAGRDEQVVLRFKETGTTETAIRACEIVVRYPEPNDDNLLSLVKAQIDYRLAKTDDQSQADPEREEDEEEPEVLEDDDQDASDRRDLELGRSLLVRLRQRLEDRNWVDANREALHDLAKPATVIDGQHRLKGAERCERGIPFTVCALFECEWAEQVFQFTVINYTQAGIQDQFITNNAALSLTQTELNKLQDRLVQAGVDVVEYQLMKVVHFSDESPFKDLVNLTEDKRNDLIGYKTMVRLAKVWYDARHPVFRYVLPSLYPEIGKKSEHKKRVARWRKGDWGVFFLDFWRVVHENYHGKPSHKEGHTLWEVGHSNLIVAIVLFELQSAFLNALNQQDEEFFVVRSLDAESAKRELREKVQRRTTKFLEWFPAEFFGMKWGYSSLSIGPGRKALQDCFGELVLKKGNHRYAASGLVTGQT